MYIKRDDFSFGKNSDFGYLYLEEDDYGALFLESIPNQLLVRTTPDADADQVIENLMTGLAEKVPISGTTFENSGLYRSFTTSLEPLEAVSYVIPSIFLVVTLLFINLFLTQIIRSQRTEIGIYART